MNNIKPIERPPSLPSTTYKITTGHGRLYVTVSYLNGSPFEVFCSIGKSGYSSMADAEAIGRLISLALRSGISIEDIISQLKGIGGEVPTFHDGSLIQSIPDGIAHVLERYVLAEPSEENILELPPITKEEPIPVILTTNTIKCPRCGAEIPEEKCPMCPNCAWTKCGGSANVY